MDKKSVGAPSKFKSEYCAQLIDHMSEGYSFESFAGKIRVNRDTIFNWVKIHPEFAEAKGIANELCRLHWEKIGVTYVVSTTEVSGQGSSRSTKSSSVNSRIWELNMRTRFPKEWRDIDPENEKIKGELSEKDKQVLETFASIGIQTLEKMKK